MRQCPPTRAPTAPHLPQPRRALRARAVRAYLFREPRLPRTLYNLIINRSFQPMVYYSFILRGWHRRALPPCTLYNLP